MPKQTARLESPRATPSDAEPSADRATPAPKARAPPHRETPSPTEPATASQKSRSDSPALPPYAAAKPNDPAHAAAAPYDPCPHRAAAWDPAAPADSRIHRPSPARPPPVPTAHPPPRWRAARWPAPDPRRTTR